MIFTARLSFVFSRTTLFKATGACSSSVLWLQSIVISLMTAAAGTELPATVIVVVVAVVPACADDDDAAAAAAGLTVIVSECSTGLLGCFLLLNETCACDAATMHVPCALHLTFGVFCFSVGVWSVDA